MGWVLRNLLHKKNTVFLNELMHPCCTYLVNFIWKIHHKEHTHRDIPIHNCSTEKMLMRLIR